MWVQICDGLWVNPDQISRIERLRYPNGEYSIMVSYEDRNWEYNQGSAEFEGFMRWLRLQNRVGRAATSPEIKVLDDYLFDDVMGAWTGAHKRDRRMAEHMLGKLDMAAILCREWVVEERKKEAERED